MAALLDELPSEILVHIFSYLNPSPPGHGAVLDPESAYDFTGTFLADRNNTVDAEALKTDSSKYLYDEIGHPRRHLCCWQRSDLLNLCLVNRRIRSIAQQQLYSAYCATGGINPKAEVRLLTRTLRERPDLAEKMVEMTVPLSHKDVRNYVDSLISLAPHIQHLHLRRHGEHTPSSPLIMWDNDYDAPPGSCNHRLRSHALQSLCGGWADRPTTPGPSQAVATASYHQQRTKSFLLPRRPRPLPWLTISSCRGCEAGNDLPQRTFYFVLAQVRDIFRDLPSVEILHLNFISKVDHPQTRRERPGAMPFDPRLDDETQDPGPLAPPRNLEEDLNDNNLEGYMSVAGKPMPRVIDQNAGNDEGENNNADEEGLEEGEIPRSEADDDYPLLINHPPRRPCGRILENLTELAIVQCNFTYLDLLSLMLSVGPHLIKVTIWHINWGLMSPQEYDDGTPLGQQGMSAAEKAYQQAMFNQVFKLEDALEALLPWKHTLRELIFGLDDQQYNTDLRPRPRNAAPLLERLPQFKALEVLRTEVALLPLARNAIGANASNDRFLSSALPRESLRRVFLRGPVLNCVQLVDALFDLYAAVREGRFRRLEAVEINSQGDNLFEIYEDMLRDVSLRFRDYGVELVIHDPASWTGWAGDGPQTDRSSENLSDAASDSFIGELADGPGDEADEEMAESEEEFDGASDDDFVEDSGQELSDGEDSDDMTEVPTDDMSDDEEDYE